MQETSDLLNLNQFQESQIIAEIRPEFVKSIQPLYSRQVVITGKILKKNREHHPEMNDKYDLIKILCAEPDFVCRNKRDDEVVIFYKKMDEYRFRAAIWLKQAHSPSEIHNSVLSYRLYRENELQLDTARG